MKTIIITGAGSGMGKATAQYLAKHGHKVFALDIVEQPEEENIIPISVDVTSMQSVEKAYEKVCAQTQGVDAIVHFAGIYHMDSLIEIEEEELLKIFNINVFGVYRVNKIFLPLLLNNKGRIVITSSELAPLDPLPFTGLYGITKSTVEKYAYALRMELNLLGIQVSLLRPGAVKTNMISASTKALDAMCAKTKLYAYNTKKFKKIVNTVESKTVTPERIAKLVYKIVTCQHPRYVYSVNANAYLKLLNALPDSWQVAIIKKILMEKK